MGMFDYITFEYPLPLPSEDLGELNNIDIQKSVYQTKDLGQFLDTFTVDGDGLLFYLDVQGYFEEGDKNAKSVMDGIGHFVKTGESWERDDRTCTIQFYGSFERLKNDYWLEYQAVFVHGKIEKISVIKFTIEDNTERRIRDEKWKREYIELHDFLNKWYIKCWYGPWRWIIKRLFKIYRKIKSVIPSEWTVEKFLTPW